MTRCDTKPNVHKIVLKAQIQNTFCTTLNCTALRQFMVLIKHNAQAGLALESLLIWEFEEEEKQCFNCLDAKWLDYSLFYG